MLKKAEERLIGLKNIRFIRTGEYVIPLIVPNPTEPETGCQSSKTEIAWVMATVFGSATCSSADYFDLTGKHEMAA